MPDYRFRTFRPRGLRLWHWLNATVLLGSISTVVLRKTFFNVRSNAATIAQEVQKAGGVISDKGAHEIALHLRGQMWHWHFYFGFTLAGLLVFRLLVWLFSEKKGSRSEFFQAWKMAKVPEEIGRKKALHYNIVKTSYAAFYLCLIYMASSGLTMYFSRDLGLSRPFVHSLKEIHETLLWFFVAFIVFHVGGVIYQELFGEKGLVSEMIHGGDRQS